MNGRLPPADYGVGVRDQAEPSHRSANVCSGRAFVPLSPTAMQTRLAGQDTDVSSAVSPDGVLLSCRLQNVPFHRPAIVGPPSVPGVYEPAAVHAVAALQSTPYR